MAKNTHRQQPRRGERNAIHEKKETKIAENYSIKKALNKIQLKNVRCIRDLLGIVSSLVEALNNLLLLLLLLQLSIIFSFKLLIIDYEL